MPTFGKGKEFSVDEWRFYIRQFIDQRLLVQKGEFSVLGITEKGHAVLFHNEKVSLQPFLAKKIVRKARNEKYQSEGSSTTYDALLFDELRALRMNLARTENVPPYVIFPDTTLAELSTWFPMELADLPHIAGFGQIKISKYGQAFLDAVNGYCSRNSIASRMKEKSPAALTKKVSSTTKAKSTSTANTKNESYQLYIKGLTPPQIATKRGINESTVMEHLIHFISTGDINVLKFVTKEKLQDIVKAIQVHGDAKLAILKEDLGESYSYTEIKAGVMYARRERS